MPCHEAHLLAFNTVIMSLSLQILLPRARCMYLLLSSARQFCAMGAIGWPSTFLSPWSLPYEIPFNHLPLQLHDMDQGIFTMEVSHSSVPSKYCFLGILQQYAAGLVVLLCRCMVCIHTVQPTGRFGDVHML